MKRDVDHGPYWFTIYLEMFGSVPRILPAILPAVLIGVVAAVPLLLLSAAGVVSAATMESLFDQIGVLVIVLAVVIAFAPVAASLLTLYLLPGGYGLTRWELDAGEPSARQHDLLVDSQRRVTENAPAGSIGPSKWLVLDKNDPNAFVIGTTIYVHRGLITSEYLDR